MPEPQKPNDTLVDLRLASVDNAERPVHGTATQNKTTNETPKTACRNCGKINQAESNHCTRCGHDLFADLVAELASAPSVEFQGQSEWDGKYRLARFLRSFAGVHSYLAVEGNDAASVVVLRIGPKAADPEAPSSETPVQPVFLTKTVLNRRRPDETDDTIPLPVVYTGPQEPLGFERDMLGITPAGIFPKLLRTFVERDYQCLVLTPTPGIPLLDAWHDPDFDAASKVRWLEQIRQVFAALHSYHLVFARLDPNSLFVDSESQVRFNALQGLVRVPVQQLDSEWNDFSTAPELVANPSQVDLRADGYCYGSLLLALHLGRNLTEADFLLPGVPKPLTELLADAPPPLVRLLSKTFVHNVNLRFPSPRFRWRDPSGFDEIGEALAEYGRAVGSVGFDIAGWSTTGTIRGSNEDCFTVTYQTSGAREYRRDIAFLCVADGMGGHAGGEVASALASSTMNAYLRDRGLSVESLQPLGREHPFDDIERSSALLREAVDAANNAVRDAAQADPNRPTMGCTLEAMLLIDRKGVLCHVGDSRVYHFSENHLKQITRDQTMVNRLVDLGRLTNEEAASHPRRFELAQAIGSQKDIVPDQFVLELFEGEWLLLCSDGLTAHVSEKQMAEVLSVAPNAELAARRLVNLAIAQGGSDNCTLIAVKVR